MKILKYAAVATAGIAAYVALKEPVKDVFNIGKRTTHTVKEKVKEPRDVAEEFTYDEMVFKETALGY